MKAICLSALFLLAGLGNFVPARGQNYSNTFPLGDVTLNEGPFQRARDLNIKHLLEYDVDRLLAPYLKEAQLEPRAQSFENWSGLDGHIGGHYLSAMAIHYAATRHPECKLRMDYMLAELLKCQDANTERYPEWGIGYIGGIPGSKDIWVGFQKGDLHLFHQAWVPWYNIHKMYAGLRDAWQYGGSLEAKAMFLKYCDWGISITSGLTDEKMEAMLGTEHGGMNEIFADAYQMTGDNRYLTAAKRFSHKFLLHPLSNKHDILDNLHANTQVPKATGFHRIAELSGDETYEKAGEFFWETVTSKRSLAFGGNSRREHFPSAHACNDYVDDVEGPESCNTYNMLRLTESLFRIKPEARYADFYERAVLNHILSTQHPEHGGYVYFTPARPRHYRVYSAPNQAMWCCVGTGMENHGKYNEFIYTHHHDSLFVNLYVASELNWKEKGVVFRQETGFPFEEKSTIYITEGSASLKLMVRFPYWAGINGFRILVNGESYPAVNTPSSYVMIDRLWRKGDKVEVMLPMKSRLEQLPGVHGYYAFMHGPVLLAAKTGQEDLSGLVANDSRWGHIAHGRKIPLNEAPVIIEDDIADIPDMLVPLNDKTLHYSLSGLNMLNRAELVLEPFFQVHDSRYMMYWMILSGSEYKSYLDSLEMVENAMLELQKRTVDYVAAGEQQPEADHFMETRNSRAGNNMDEFFREAAGEGFFSYRLATHQEKNLQLLVRYWGYEWGNRRFDIYIDDEKLVSEDNTGRWYQTRFQDVVYQIPDAMVEGKDYVRVKFQALKGSTAGAVYQIRLMRNPD